MGTSWGVAGDSCTMRSSGSGGWWARADVPRDVLAPADQGPAEMLDQDVRRVGAAVQGPSAVVHGRDVTGQGRVAGLLDEPAAEALVLEEFQPVEAERQEPGPGPGQLVRPQDDALVEDGVEFAALEPSHPGRMVGHGLVEADLAAPGPDVVEAEAVRAQDHVDHDRRARVDGAAGRHPQRVVGLGDLVEAGEPEPVAHREPQLVVVGEHGDRRDLARAVERAGTTVRHGQQGRRVEGRDVHLARVDLLDDVRVVGAVEAEAPGSGVALHHHGHGAVGPLGAEHDLAGGLQEQDRPQVRRVYRRYRAKWLGHGSPLPAAWVSNGRDLHLAWVAGHSAALCTAASNPSKSPAHGPQAARWAAMPG